MEKINYPDLEAQRRAHNAFIEKLVDINFEELENMDDHQQEYLQAGKKNQDNTFLGQFILAALSQKSMVTNKIFISKNLLAGFSVDYEKMGFRITGVNPNAIRLRDGTLLNEYCMIREIRR